MVVLSRPRWWVLAAFLMTLVLTFTPSTSAFASARASSLFQISSDLYTNSTSQHQTEVEPDSYSNGSTIVSATQVGRFNDGVPPISGGQLPLIMAQLGEVASCRIPLCMQRLQARTIGSVTPQ